MKSETAPATGNEESLKRSVEQVKDAAETLLRTTVGQTGEEWRRARHAFGGKARALRSSMSGSAKEFAEEARELGGKGQRLVQQHPWASIGIGAGLGLLAGLLVRRR
ncbi:MAG TPA: hypothetical protein VFK00_06245 [Rhodanobacteraceae bacterium]|jgi:ElaB/YqjD/DUF883 family membrane-anchored ribosome-binding protein|nr:hypothetical protein [Rhodanobacteraceae bacterium]